MRMPLYSDTRDGCGRPPVLWILIALALASGGAGCHTPPGPPPTADATTASLKVSAETDASQARKVARARETPAPPPTQWAGQQPIRIDEWGIDILGIRWSAAGYVLDFRYRVHDAEKAAPLLVHQIKPHIVVEKNGAKLGVPRSPKIGSLRSSSRNVKPNRNYYVLFANPGRMVAVGDKVTVEIGEFKASHLVVQ
jgi:hypothetical protein